MRSLWRKFDAWSRRRYSIAGQRAARNEYGFPNNEEQA